jgi:hypothetical protein
MRFPLCLVGFRRERVPGAPTPRCIAQLLAFFAVFHVLIADIAAYDVPARIIGLVVLNVCRLKFKIFLLVGEQQDAKDEESEENDLE